MKPIIGKSLILFSASLLGITAMTGCSGKKNDENTLNIVCLNLGYGRDWIDELVKVWLEQNPGKKVNLDATADATGVIQKHLYDKNNIDDLYIGNTASWKTYALRGKLLELDDFLNEEVDGMKVVDKVNDEYKKSIYYNGHTYRLPWTSGVPGIYYNAKMFEENGWSVPTTYTELVALCEKIKSDAVPVGSGPKATTTVKPFCYTGQNMDYFDYATFTWWAQLAGKDNVDNYLKYESADTFSMSNPTFAHLKTALQMWYDLFQEHSDKSQDNFVDGSKGWDNHTAQQSFYNGYSAMMINCDWLYNETLKYTDDGKFRDGFELKIMNTPSATGAATDKISYIVGEDQFFAIPKTTIKADMAKSFLKLMISDQGVKTFAEKAHGTLAYKTKEKITTDDPYTNSLLDYMSHAEQRFTNWSDSTLFLNNVIDVWTERSMAPYTRVLNSSDADPVSAYFTEIANGAQSKWNEWLKQAGKNAQQ